jgi:hypothetical protein
MESDNSMDSDVSTVVDIENGESSNGADPVRDCGGSVADSLTSPRTPNPAAVSSAPPATNHVNMYTIEAILGLSSGQSHCLAICVDSISFNLNFSLEFG